MEHPNSPNTIEVFFSQERIYLHPNQNFGKREDVMKQKINYIVDLVLLIAFLTTGITGLIKWRLLMTALGIVNLYFVLPMGTIRVIHEWASFAFMLLAWIHIILHWKWIALTTKKIFKRGIKK